MSPPFTHRNSETSMMKRPLSLLLLITSAWLAVSQAAFAAGFAIQAQNGSGNGNAFAGAAALAEDAGAVFFNPAGLVLLPAGHNLAIAATYLDRKIEFTDNGTTPNLNPTVASTNGGDAGGSSVIPAAYWALVKDGLAFGLGISPTFGNKTEYETTFVGRYSGYYANLEVFNVNPSVAYRISDVISIGGGASYARGDIEFRQIAPVFAASFGALADRDVRLKGDGSAWGYNVGVLAKLSEQARVGIAYRSAIKLDLGGTQTVSGAALPGALGVSLPQSVGISGTLELPDNLSFAVTYDLSPQFQFLADYTRTGWSSIKRIDVTRQDGVAHPGLTYNFKDTYRVGVGINYRLNDGWKLRAGVAFDQTPVQSAADTTMTLPDSDRRWLSLGARLGLSTQQSVDVGYSHIFFKDASTARPVTSGATTLQTIRGGFETSADYLSVQYNHNF
jgi:long-chain fatty acid transport protein